MQNPVSTSMGDLPQGTLLYDQRFKIDVMLEANAGRAIYRASDSVLNKPATILEVYTPQPQRIEPALAKAIPLVQLEHPAISPIEVIFTQQDRLFIALSIPGGQTISRIMSGRTTPIPPGAALRWIAQIADALTFFAKPPLGWSLGDISPTALLVTAEDRVQVIGIEIALGLQLPQQVAASLPAGSVAPELQTGLCDARSDVYSMAATLFLLLTNRPWQGEHTPSLAQLRPDLPAPLIATIAHAISTDRSERWDDVALFYQRLRQSLPATRTDTTNSWWSTPIVTQDELDDEPPTLNIQRTALAAAVAAEAARIAAEQSTTLAIPTEEITQTHESEATAPVIAEDYYGNDPAITTDYYDTESLVSSGEVEKPAENVEPAVGIAEIPMSDMVAILPVAEPLPTHTSFAEPTADVIVEESPEELTYVDIQPLLTEEEMAQVEVIPVEQNIIHEEKTPTPLFPYVEIGAAWLYPALHSEDQWTTSEPELDNVQNLPEPEPDTLYIIPSTEWHQSTIISSHEPVTEPLQEQSLLLPRNTQPEINSVPNHATPFGFLRTLLRMPPSLTTPATASVVFPSYMYPQQSYQILFRIQCRPLVTERMAHVAIVEAETNSNSFFLPIRKLALHLPLEGGVSEGTMPISVVVATYLDEIERVIFTFRDEHGTILHQGQFIADIKILSPQQASHGDDHTSLVHVLDVDHLIPPTA